MASPRQSLIQTKSPKGKFFELLRLGRRSLLRPALDLWSLATSGTQERAMGLTTFQAVIDRTARNFSTATARNSSQDLREAPEHQRSARKRASSSGKIEVWKASQGAERKIRVEKVPESVDAFGDFS